MERVKVDGGKGKAAQVLSVKSGQIGGVKFSIWTIRGRNLFLSKAIEKLAERIKKESVIRGKSVHTSQVNSEEIEISEFFFAKRAVLKTSEREKAEVLEILKSGDVGDGMSKRKIESSHGFLKSLEALGHFGVVQLHVKNDGEV